MIHWAQLGSPHSMQFPGNSLKVISSTNYRAHLACFSLLRDDCPLLPDGPCIKNPCFIHFVKFLIASDKRVILSLLFHLAQKWECPSIMTFIFKLKYVLIYIDIIMVFNTIQISCEHYIFGFYIYHSMHACVLSFFSHV